MKTQIRKIYLTKMSEVIDEKLYNLAELGVRLDELYKRDGEINSTKLCEWLLNTFDSVESICIVPTDFDTPYIKTKLPILENTNKYIEEKIAEGKVVAVCDSYECDYVIFK